MSGTGNLERLLKVSGPSLAASAHAQGSSPLLVGSGLPGAELAQLLKTRNGFQAFESALQLYPLRGEDFFPELETWNDPTLWKLEFGDLLPAKQVFFAQDAFGMQFSIRADGVWQLDSETGAAKPFAPTLDDWARQILDEYNYLTGYSLIHEWQLQHGPIQPGKRLIPKTPFVAGGPFELDNLYAGDIVEAMRFRGYFAQQIKDLPDGAQVRLRVTD